MIENIFYNNFVMVLTILVTVSTIYILISKSKINKYFLILLFSVLVSDTIFSFNEILLLGILVLVLFIYAINYSNHSLLFSLFSSFYAVFWTILIRDTFSVGLLLIRQNSSNNFVWFSSYLGLGMVLIVHFVMTRLFDIDFKTLSKKENIIESKILTPMNRLQILFFLIYIFILLFSEILSMQFSYLISSIFYIFLQSTLYFVFLGILSTKIKNYLVIIIKKEKDQRYHELKKYTEDVEFMQREMAGFRHDMKNIWISFSEVIQSKDQEFIESTFNNIKEKLAIQIEEADKVSHDLANMKETITKGILHQKYLLAKDNRVEMKIDIKNEIECIPIEMLDFIRVIGIFLDNAIEEAVVSERKEVFVGFVRHKDKLVIEIINSTNKENIPISKIFKEGYTTKKEEGGNRGKGLAIVSNILEDTPKVVLNTNHNYGMFNQTLKIWNSDENQYTRR